MRGGWCQSGCQEQPACRRGEAECRPRQKMVLHLWYHFRPTLGRPACFGPKQKRASSHFPICASLKSCYLFTRRHVLILTGRHLSISRIVASWLRLWACSVGIRDPSSEARGPEMGCNLQGSQRHLSAPFHVPQGGDLLMLLSVPPAAPPPSPPPHTHTAKTQPHNGQLQIRM